MTIFRMYSRVLFPGLIISIFNFCTAQSTAISGKIAPMKAAAPIRTVSPNADCPLNDNRPAFTWQPGREVPNGSTYALVVVELSEKQDAAKALAANPRLIDRKSIRGNSLSFPRNLKPLVPGRVYAYQITSEPPKSAPNAKPVKSDIAVFFLQPALPFDLQSITCCESNLLKDGAAAWTTAYGTPHISPKQAGCFNSGGLIEMSGNRQAGTAVHALQLTADLGGHQVGRHVGRETRGDSVERFERGWFEHRRAGWQGVGGKCSRGQGTRR